MGSVVGDVLGKNQSPPPSPDYTGAAIAQGQANLQAGQQSASLSNPNIYGPYGQQTVTYTPTGPDGSMQPNVYQTLAPSQQALLNQQNALKMGLANLGSDALSRVGGVMSTPFQFNGPDVQMSLGDAGPITMSANQNGRLDLSGVAKMPINAGTTALQAGLSRLMPTLNQQRTSLETNLTNQGLRPGAEAWSNAMRDQSMRENDLQAALVRDSLGLDLTANQQGFGQALQQGQFGNQANLTNAQFANAAQQQQFGQNQAAAQFGNQAQQQALQQALYQRQMPLNELNAMMSGSQVSLPQYQNYQGANVAATPVFGGAQAQGAYDQNVYSNQVAQNNAMTSGLVNIAAMGAYAMSDQRLKSHIERVGTHPLGIGIYEYDIFDRRERGVMAQEVLTVKPDAVAMHPSGYLMVDYAAI
jgi:hypothetical protein